MFSPKKKKKYLKKGVIDLHPFFCSYDNFLNFIICTLTKKKTLKKKKEKIQKVI